MRAQIDRRPSPLVKIKAPGFPIPWREVIEDELTAAQLDLKSIMGGGKKARHIYEVRNRIWMRLRARGASYSSIGRRFGYHHTSVLWAVGAIKKK